MRSLAAKLPWQRLFGPSSVLLGTTVATNLLRIVSTMVLTRLLSPSDFGLLGIIMSIFMVIGMLTDAGFQAFLVRHERGLEPEFLDAVWTIHALRGILSTAAILMFAVPLGYLLAKPEITPLLAVVSITFAIDGCASLSLLTSLRERLVRRLSVLDLVIAIVQFAASIVAALMLRDAWALVAAMIVASCCRTAASYLIFPRARRRPRFDRAISGELWRFSRLIGASSALTLLTTQFDKLVLARLFTLPQFGIYAIAANLAGAPTTLAYMYTSRIMYPAFAERWRERPESIGAFFYELRGLVVYGYLFAAGGLIGAAPLAVRILYDPRYAGAGLYLRLLALTTALTMLTKPMNDFLVAIGHTRTTLTANFMRLGWLAVGALAGFLLLGPIGLVVALGLIELPPYFYSAIVMRRLGYYDARAEAKAFALIAAGAIVGLAADRLALAAHLI